MRGAPASPSGSRADASSPQAVSTKGFDPSRILSVLIPVEACLRKSGGCLCCLAEVQTLIKELEG